MTCTLARPSLSKIVAHVRGEKLRVFKFKPKRGYKRRTGHRQDLTRIEVTDIKLSAARRRKATPTPVAAEPVTSNETPEATNGA